MLKFICFGSGSSGNSYYLSNGKEAIIIDAGIGIRTMKKYILEYGINVTKIKGILITHDHFDHSRAAGELCKLFNTKIYTSELVADKLSGSFRSRINKDMCVCIEQYCTFNIGDFIIEPFRIPHDSADNYGYTISCGDSIFTIMTDIGEPTETVKQHIRKSNFLVIEADYDEEMLQTNKRYDAVLKRRIRGGNGHLCNTQTAELLYDHGHSDLKYVWLCHLSAENNKPELAKQTIEDYFDVRQKNRHFALEILKRKSPSGPWILGD